MKVVWTEYVKYKAKLRGFDLANWLFLMSRKVAVSNSALILPPR